MLWTSTKRILRSGLTNFWRNSFVSLASIVVMSVTLFLIGVLIFTGAILDTTLGSLQSKVDVNVYFVPDAPEEDILTLKEELERLPEVAEVEYVSRDEALARFEERHRDEALVIQALEELEENPLGANLNVRAQETSQYEGIAAFLEERQNAGGSASVIDKVNYLQNKVVIDRLTSVIDSAQTFGILVTLIFITASIVIVFNTIRLAIYTSRDEIGVMRLVGASNAYIRGPFVIEGMLYGILSAIVTLVFFYPLTYWLGPKTEGFFAGINLFDYYLANFGSIFLIIVGSGIIVGALASYLSVRKYLKI